ncbi:glycosyltransferase family 25 protein [Granulicella aggregans]|uniref:glycosyltransferase family 25 protein n=1 Tax=Granulicella aggregans TaxID=474949 RepID=UPI0021E09019|nr:glycosyltransferase family 25 protein [Granulicella aggregans]
MRISLINLERSTERLASFLEINKHLSDVYRVPAVDGSTLDRGKLREGGILADEMPLYTNGALGCALSHLAQWNLAANNDRFVTIAEDDAIFHLQFEPLAEKVIASLPPDWDIIQWGWNFDSILAFDLMPGISNSVAVFDQVKLRENVAAYMQLPVTPVAYRLQRSLGTVCQSISPTGAAKLLRHCLPIRPMEAFYPILNRSLPNTGIDNMMNDLYPQMNAYVSLPPLVITKNEIGASTVQGNR